jgi:hypothetical protein
MPAKVLLNPSEIAGIPVLLRLIMAIDNIKGPDMMRALQNRYGIEFTGEDKKQKSNNFNRICREGTGLYNTPYVKNWKNFYITEESNYMPKLKKALYGKDYNEKSFSKPNKFNWESVYSLIDSTYTAESIVFLNTYIDLEEWFDPIIQMHLCIQKSIEQKINFFRVQECHKNYKEKDKNKFIGECNKMPPVYRQYRIMFLPMTKSELKQIIDEKGREYETLCYVAYMHTSLSIQLAIFTLDDWGDLINTNKAFFAKENNLHALKLNPDLVEIIRNKFNYPAIYSSIKSSIEAQKIIPSDGVNEGIDLLCTLNINHTSTHDASFGMYDEIWASFYNKDSNGLNYYKIENEEVAKIKVEFTKILFSHITEEHIATKAKHKKLDPIHTFYANNLKHFKGFTNQHDASLILNLEK